LGVSKLLQRLGIDKVVADQIEVPATSTKKQTVIVVHENRAYIWERRTAAPAPRSGKNSYTTGSLAA